MIKMMVNVLIFNEIHIEQYSQFVKNASIEVKFNMKQLDYENNLLRFGENLKILFSNFMTEIFSNLFSENVLFIELSRINEGKRLETILKNRGLYNQLKKIFSCGIHSLNDRKSDILFEKSHVNNEKIENIWISNINKVMKRIKQRNISNLNVFMIFGTSHSNIINNNVDFILSQEKITLPGFIFCTEYYVGINKKIFSQGTKKFNFKIDKIIINSISYES